MVEDAIRQQDLISLAKSVQQLAVDEAKARLNFAVCPGALLMPAAQMVINKESTLGSSNQLPQAIKFE